MSSYTKKFAPYYDEEWNNFSTEVFKYFKKYLENKDVCDVACGTGNFIKLAKRITGSISGIDKSKDFVAYAKKKNPGVKFKIIDIERWNEKNKYDVITCFYDSVNHFSNWSKAFKNIYQALKPKGLFVFDVNTIQGLKKWNNAHSNKIKNGRIDMRGRFKKSNSARMEIKIFNKKNKCVCQEVIEEKTYSIDKIKRMLKKAGFQNIRNIGNIINSKNKSREFFIVQKSCKR